MLCSDEQVVDVCANDDGSILVRKDAGLANEGFESDD